MNKSSAIHVACSTDDSYAVLCGVMLYSLLANSNDSKQIHIHILISSLNKENRKKFSTQAEKFGAKLTFHVVDDTLLEGCKYRTRKHQLSKAAYYRILLSSILPDIDTIVYLDCDMVVLGDLAPLMEFDISRYAVAAVEDYGLLQIPTHRQQLQFTADDHYFNSGFMLINLRYWRDHDSEKQLLEFSKRERNVFFHDQDAMNAVFRKTWLRLPPACNHFNVFQVWSEYMFSNKEELQQFDNAPYVIHYGDRYFKPWFKLPLIPYWWTWRRFKRLSEWKDYVLKSPEKVVYTVAKIFYAKIKYDWYKLKFGLR